MQKVFHLFLIFVLLIAGTACAQKRGIFPQESASADTKIASSANTASKDEAASAHPDTSESAVSESQDIATAVFSLGFPEEEERSMGVGDTIGEWTLSDLQIRYINGNEIKTVEALFEGTVTLRGTITRNSLMEEGYDFTVTKEDQNKIPQYISPHTKPKDDILLVLTIPEDCPNAPNLSHGERQDCTVTLSDYRFVFAHTMAPASATVIKIALS